MADKSKSEPLNAYDDLVRTVEILSNQKISDFRLDKIKESFAQMRQREALDVARQLAGEKLKSGQDYVAKLYKDGVVDPKWNMKTFVTDNKNYDAITYANQFVLQVSNELKATPMPRLYLVFGNAGSGKTVLLHTMANAFLNLGCRSLELTTFDRIINTCYFQSDERRDERIERQEEWEYFCRVKVLMIDGLGSITDGFNLFEQKVLSRLLRTRFAAGLPMVISTAIKTDDLHTAIGSFAYESIKEYQPICTALMGGSRRQGLSLSTFANTGPIKLKG